MSKKNFNKKYFVLTLIFAALMALCLYGSVIFTPDNAALPELVAQNATLFRGLSVVGAVFSAIFTVKFFIKLMSAEKKRQIAEKLSRLAKRISRAVTMLVSKVLGISLSSGRLRGKDEKSFVYSSQTKEKRKRARLKNTARWEDTQNNAEKVRFIFTDYMIGKIKGGYFMRHSMTTDEIGVDIGVGEDEEILFQTYKKARYAGELSLDEIDDGTVEALREINCKK